MSFKGTKKITVFLDLLRACCQFVEAVHRFRKEWVHSECRVELGWKSWGGRWICEGEKEKKGWIKREWGRTGSFQCENGGIRSVAVEMTAEQELSWDDVLKKLCWPSYLPWKREMRRACVTLRFPLLEKNNLCWFSSSKSLFLGLRFPWKDAPWIRKRK